MRRAVHLSGRIITADHERQIPHAGLWAVLHRIGPSGAGPVDSVRTDRNGAYRLTIQHPDTVSQYTVAVRYSGVAYVSPHLGPGSIASRDLGAISVFDTSSSSPVDVSQRHLLVQPANPDGSVPVLELLVLHIGGNRTRVGADSTRPSWTGEVLQGAEEVEVGEGDLTAEAVTRVRDSISILAPLPPGDKQIVLTYVLPRGEQEIVLPRPGPIGELDLMVADTLARLVDGPMRNLGVATFENIRYQRWEGREVSAGPPIRMRFSSRPAAPEDLWWIVVAASAVAMAAALLSWWRARGMRSESTEAEHRALAKPHQHP